MKRLLAAVIFLGIVVVSVQATDVTISIPDKQFSRYINAFAKHHNYEVDAEKDETKAQFVKRKELERIKRIVAEVETDEYHASMAAHLQETEDEWKEANPKTEEITAE